MATESILVHPPWLVVTPPFNIQFSEPITCQKSIFPTQTTQTEQKRNYIIIDSVSSEIVSSSFCPLSTRELPLPVEYYRGNMSSTQVRVLSLSSVPEIQFSRGGGVRASKGSLREDPFPIFIFKISLSGFLAGRTRSLAWR